MIVALQAYQNPDDGQGDLPRALALARLLADLEPEPRDDVLLAIVLQPGTPLPPLLHRTLAHCGRKLPVELAVGRFEGRGHPRGCTALWRSTIHHFHERRAILHSMGGRLRYRDHGPHGSSLLTLDGGDGVPLHACWLNAMILLHHVTRLQDKLVTGTPYFLGTCPLHVNPNAVFELELFDEHPELLEDVPCDGTIGTNFDVYHREVMLSEACLSSAVRTDWRGDGQSLTPEILRNRSSEAVWLHGYRDPGLFRLAREHLATGPHPLTIRHYSIEQLRQHELVRRSYEEAGR